MDWNPRLLSPLAAAGLAVTLGAAYPLYRAHGFGTARERVLSQAPAQMEAPAAEPAPAAPAGTGENDAAPKPTAEEVRFVELVNQERARRGLRLLKIEPLLITIARRHSTEMRDRGYFSHESPTPDLRTPKDRYLKALATVPEYACVGENLYYCSLTDVDRGHRAFMTSPSHRDNVLYPRFEKIGVGIVKNSLGEFWVTQMFLTNTPPETTARRLSSRK